MAKFVHVDADRVRSGMRRFQKLRADDADWIADEKRFEALVDEVRVRRDGDKYSADVARRRQGVVDPARPVLNREAD